MLDLDKNGFYSPTKGSLTVRKMLQEISEFVSEDPGGFYSLVIGTDSQIKNINGAAQCDFVTAIVIHRKGKGARYFWKKDKIHKAPVLRDKIYTETTKSLETAHELVPSLRRKITPAKYDLEIHIDLA